MSDRPARLRRRVLVLSLAILAAGPVRAEPAVRILDLPFKVREMRGPRSEVAVSVATSGLLPIARAKDGDSKNAGNPAGEAESAPIAVVWGDEGGAVLSLENGSVAARPIGREAVEGLTAAETPRGALPGSRRALAGPLSAYLTGRTRTLEGAPAASVLTIRERQPMAVSADPKPVPVTTITVPAGDDAVFAPTRPRVLRLSGRPVVLAATLSGVDSGSLALIARPGGDPKAAWSITARTPPGAPVKIAAVADFSGRGVPEAATVDARGVLRLWTLAPDRIEAAGEVPGYVAGEGDTDLADAVTTAGATAVALPVMGMPALALVSAKDGLKERLRVGLPAPAATGVAALGEGTAARLLVGLADGRVAAIAPDGGKP